MWLQRPYVNMYAGSIPEWVYSDAGKKARSFSNKELFHDMQANYD